MPAKGLEGPPWSSSMTDKVKQCIVDLDTVKKKTQPKIVYKNKEIA